MINKTSYLLPGEHDCYVTLNNQFNIILWHLYRENTFLSSVLVSLVTSLDVLHVVSRVESYPPVFPAFTPALFILVLQLLELLAWKAASLQWESGGTSPSLLTSFEGEFVRFSCLVVVQSSDRKPRLAVISQHVLAVIFVKLLVIEWIGILRTVAETFKQLC